MNQTWQNLLQHASELKILNYNELPSAYMPLEYNSVIDVSGEDASQFLQNLVTNDVTGLAVNQAQYAGVCNPKGRLLAFFTLIRRQHGFQIVVPTCIASSLMARLKMYVLRSKVTISDVSDQVACLGLVTKKSSTELPLELAENDYQGIETEHYFSLKLPSTDQRWLILCPSEQLASVHALIKDTVPLAPPAFWDVLDIKAGIATVKAETQEKFTPQQLNLDLNNAVSFSKGCYPGQEVVARLHYLGKANRRLFLAEANTAAKIEIGSDVKTSDGQVAGHIVNAALQSKDHLVVLISLKLALQQQTLVLSDGSHVNLADQVIEDA